MKKSLFVILITFPFFILTNQNNIIAQSKNGNNIIIKNNGRIILAYKVFEDFLNSDKSWENYKNIVLDAYPVKRAVHNKTLSWKKSAL